MTDEASVGNREGKSNWTHISAHVTHIDDTASKVCVTQYTPHCSGVKPFW